MNITINTNHTMQGIAEVLQEQLISCSSFNMATAFIDSYSINLIENCLKKNKALKNGKVLIGVYNCFNKKEDLEYLHKLSKKYPTKIEIHISKYYKFHWKYYEFTKNRTTTSYIGSANFTNAGQNTNAEILVGIKNNKELNNAFEKQWKQSASISSFPLINYKTNFGHLNLNQKIPTELGSFFKLHKNELDFVPNPSNYDKVVVCFLHGIMPNKESKAVEKYKNNWVNKDYFSCYNKRQHDECITHKSLVFIERKENKLYFSNAVAIDSSNKINTIGNNYYIAYKKIGSSKILRETQIEALKKLNVLIKKRNNEFYFKVFNTIKIENIINNVIANKSMR